MPHVFEMLLWIFFIMNLVGSVSTVVVWLRAVLLGYRINIYRCIFWNKSQCVGLCLYLYMKKIFTSRFHYVLMVDGPWNTSGWTCGWSVHTHTTHLPDTLFLPVKLSSLRHFSRGVLHSLPDCQMCLSLFPNCDFLPRLFLRIWFM
jgi:hypothetical protein